MGVTAGLCLSGILLSVPRGFPAPDNDDDEFIDHPSQPPKAAMRQVAGSLGYALLSLSEAVELGLLSIYFTYLYRNFS